MRRAGKCKMDLWYWAPWRSELHPATTCKFSGCPMEGGHAPEGLMVNLLEGGLLGEGGEEALASDTASFASSSSRKRGNTAFPSSFS